MEKIKSNADQSTDSASGTVAERTKFLFVSKSKGALIFLRVNGKRKTVRFLNYTFSTTDQSIAEALMADHRYGRNKLFWLDAKAPETPSPFRTYRNAVIQKARVTDSAEIGKANREKQKRKGGKFVGRGAVTTGNAVKSAAVEEKSVDKPETSTDGASQ